MMLLLLLLGGHALCDYPLQGDFLARGKNHTNPIAGVPWWQCLWAHSMIHAGMVALVTQNPLLGAAELVIHMVSDYLKCAGHISFNVDQAVHIVCKLLWAALVIGK